MSAPQPCAYARRPPVRSKTLSYYRSDNAALFGQPQAPWPRFPPCGHLSPAAARALPSARPALGAAPPGPGPGPLARRRGSRRRGRRRTWLERHRARGTHRAALNVQRRTARAQAPPDALPGSNRRGAGTGASQGAAAARPASAGHGWAPHRASARTGGKAAALAPPLRGLLPPRLPPGPAPLPRRAPPPALEPALPAAPQRDGTGPGRAWPGLAERTAPEQRRPVPLPPPAQPPDAGARGRPEHKPAAALGASQPARTRPRSAALKAAVGAARPSNPRPAPHVGASSGAGRAAAAGGAPSAPPPPPGWRWCVAPGNAPAAVGGAGAAARASAGDSGPAAQGCGAVSSESSLTAPVCTPTVYLHLLAITDVHRSTGDAL